MAPRRMVCGLHGGRRLGAEWGAEATGGWERRASSFPSFPSPTAGVLCQGAGVIISISSASLITSITQLSSVSVESNSFDPMACSTPGLPVHHQLPESTQTLVRRVGDAIQPSHPLSSPLLLPPILPSIRVFSNESALHIRWPKYWGFSFSISPSNEYSGLIFGMDWLDLLASKELSRVSLATVKWRTVSFHTVLCQLHLQDL